MRKIVMVGLMLAVCVAMTGCFTFDAQHNRDQKKIIMADLGLIHTDVDFLLDLEQPTLLDGGIYW